MGYGALVSGGVSTGARASSSAEASRRRGSPDQQPLGSRRRTAALGGSYPVCGGLQARLPSGLSGPVSCGWPARLLKKSSVSQRSWMLPAARVQPVITPPLLTLTIEAGDEVAVVAAGGHGRCRPASPDGRSERRAPRDGRTIQHLAVFAGPQLVSDGLLDQDVSAHKRRSRRLRHSGWSCPGSRGASASGHSARGRVGSRARPSAIARQTQAQHFRVAQLGRWPTGYGHLWPDEVYVQIVDHHIQCRQEGFEIEFHGITSPGFGLLLLEPSLLFR